MKRIFSFVATFLVTYALLGFLSTIFVSVKLVAEATVWDVLRIKFHIAVYYGWFFKAFLATIYSVAVNRYIYKKDKSLE